MKSILQDWVSTLGLRHQGVMLTAVRGCDTASKHHHSKLLTQFYRGSILNTHCAPNVKPGSFIKRPWEQPAAFADARRHFLQSHDELPHHFVMHLVHAAEIVGYHHPDEDLRHAWREFYLEACRKLHMNPETPEELDARLGADEASFVAAQ
jgi:hypothetical protein